jgi:TM2 domain-containing membrane protein YozV
MVIIYERYLLDSSSEQLYICEVFVMSVAQELKELKELLDSEVITQEEFDNQKRKILSVSSSGNNQSSVQNGFEQAPATGQNQGYTANAQYPQNFGYSNMPPVINIVNTNNNTNNNNNASQMTSPKSKIIALVLCIFGGFFGLHCFYVGKIGTGLLYLLTVGLFGIGWIIDIITILVGSYRDRDNLRLA